MTAAVSSNRQGMRGEKPHRENPRLGPRGHDVEEQATDRHADRERVEHGFTSFELIQINGVERRMEDRSPGGLGRVARVRPRALSIVAGGGGT